MGNADAKTMVDAIKAFTEVPASKLSGMGWGTIKSVKPLILVAEHGVELSGNLLERSPFCYEWTTKRLKHKHTFTDKNDGEKSSGDRVDAETSEQITEFTFWRGLHINDKVCYLRMNESQKYLILWRENQFDLDPLT